MHIFECDLWVLPTQVVTIYLSMLILYNMNAVAGLVSSESLGTEASVHHRQHSPRGPSKYLVKFHKWNSTGWLIQDSTNNILIQIYRLYLLTWSAAKIKENVKKLEYTSTPWVLVWDYTYLSSMPLEINKKPACKDLYWNNLHL